MNLIIHTRLLHNRMCRVITARKTWIQVKSRPLAVLSPTRSAAARVTTQYIVFEAGWQNHIGFSREGLLSLVAACFL